MIPSWQGLNLPVKILLRMPAPPHVTGFRPSCGLSLRQFVLRIFFIDRSRNR
ncbi:hypothetical protein SAMN05216299_108127 [Nitrosospira sp. Nsp14]|nr:hypothetical protein SAMN05216299_108127 [Nitrosospira sp. Nsp14]